MNWVGGIRTRVKDSFSRTKSRSNDKKIQREYFERQRLRSVVDVGLPQNKASAKVDRIQKKKSESQDILLFQKRNSTKKDKDRIKIQSVDLGAIRKMGKTRMKSVELPLSPGLQETRISRTSCNDVEDPICEDSKGNQDHNSETDLKSKTRAAYMSLSNGKPLTATASRKKVFPSVELFGGSVSIPSRPIASSPPKPVHTDLAYPSLFKNEHMEIQHDSGRKMQNDSFEDILKSWKNQDSTSNSNMQASQKKKSNDYISKTIYHSDGKAFSFDNTQRPLHYSDYNNESGLMSFEDSNFNDIYKSRNRDPAESFDTVKQTHPPIPRNLLYLQDYGTQDTQDTQINICPTLHGHSANESFNLNFEESLSNSRSSHFDNSDHVLSKTNQQSGSLYNTSFLDMSASNVGYYSDKRSVELQNQPCKSPSMTQYEENDNQHNNAFYESLTFLNESDDRLFSSNSDIRLNSNSSASSLGRHHQSPTSPEFFNGLFGLQRSPSIGKDNFHKSTYHKSKTTNLQTKTDRQNIVPKHGNTCVQKDKHLGWKSSREEYQNGMMMSNSVEQLNKERQIEKSAKLVLGQPLADDRRKELHNGLQLDKTCSLNDTTMSVFGGSYNIDSNDSTSCKSSNSKDYISKRKSRSPFITHSANKNPASFEYKVNGGSIKYQRKDLISFEQTRNVNSSKHDNDMTKSTPVDKSQIINHSSSTDVETGTLVKNNDSCYDGNKSINLLTPNVTDPSLSPDSDIDNGLVVTFLQAQGDVEPQLNVSPKSTSAITVIPSHTHQTVSPQSSVTKAQMSQPNSSHVTTALYSASKSKSPFGCLTTISDKVITATTPATTSSMTSETAPARSRHLAESPSQIHSGTQLGNDIDRDVPSKEQQNELKPSSTQIQNDSNILQCNENIRSNCCTCGLEKKNLSCSSTQTTPKLTKDASCGPESPFNTSNISTTETYTQNNPQSKSYSLRPRPKH